MGDSMSVQQLAQAAANGVRQSGWLNADAKAYVEAFQKAWNAQQNAEMASGDSGPPDTLNEDGKWGPLTQGAAVTAGAQNAPPAYFDPAEASSGTSSATGAAGSLNGHPIDASGMNLAQSVADAFFDFTTKFEGYTRYPYTDSKGLVTTGVGNLVDSGGGSAEPTATFMRLPWKNPDGSLASDSQKTDAWHAIKSAWPGVQSTADQKLTSIRLDVADVAKLVRSHLASDNRVLSQRYPNFAQLPAAAQLALHSIAWAWGPAFSKVWGATGTKFDQAIAAQDFTTASDLMSQASAHEESINPGIRPRDLANKALFLEAAAVKTLGLDPLSLFYPGPVGSAVAGAAAAAGAFVGAVTSNAGKVAGLALLGLFGLGLIGWGLSLRSGS